MNYTRDGEDSDTDTDDDCDLSPGDEISALCRVIRIVSPDKRVSSRLIDEPDGRHGSEEHDGYIVLREVGQGQYGRIFLVADIATGHEYVLKAIRCETPADAMRALNEARAQLRLQHAHVVVVFSAFFVGRTACLVMEKCPFGDLKLVQKSFEDQNRRIPPAVAIEWTRQILAAVVHLHAAGIIHRDIKPANSTPP